MKVAVFSDIQANLPAFEETVAEITAWRPDLVVMAGDLVNRGPDSLGCLLAFDAERRGAGWLPVNGNHEVWVLSCAAGPAATPAEREVRRFTDWAWQQVQGHAEQLRGWPDHLSFGPPDATDAWVHVTHGTMQGNRDGVTERVSDAALAAGKLPEDVALFVCGHTHRPLTRQVGATTVVNVGSAGSPFDGDPRASYGRFTWRGGRWQAEIRRFRYDRARTRRDFEDSGFLDQGPLARLIWLEWERAALLMSGWRERYQDAVLAGTQDLTRSVDDYLREVGLGWRAAPELD